MEPTLDVTVLYRPVGASELALIAASGFRAFPPRLEHQPIFYPVLSREYAEQIARDWNTRDAASGHVGFVTQFAVERAFLDRYEAQTVGSRSHREYWIPAEDLEAFNRHLVGEIRVIAEFRGDGVMPFDAQPILKSPLIELRPLLENDFDDLFAVASDPLIWEQHPSNDRYKESVFREFFRGAMHSGGALIVLDARDGRVIGSSRYFGYDAKRSEVEIGWSFLARDYWGGRYNGEMKRLMLEHAFRFVEHVVFLVGPNNLRSQKALEKIGAVRKGTRIGAEGRESVVYELTSPTGTSRGAR